MTQTPKLLIVGSINKDIIFYGPHGTEMKLNGCLVFDSCGSFNGGKGANQAAAAAALGAESYLVGAVGQDQNGQEMLRALNGLHVHTDYVLETPEAQTGLSAIFTMPGGSYIGTNVLGANQCITPDMVREALDAQPFHMVLMQLEMPLETVYRTHELARERGLRVILDAGPAKKIDLSRLKGIYMISPNEAETEALCGIMPADEASVQAAAQAIYREAQPQYVLLKLGGRGAYLYDGREGRSFPAFHVHCVDSTGAGDVFSGTLMTAMSQGMPMDRAIVYANCAASLSVTKSGVTESIPTIEEVNALFTKVCMERGM